MSAARHQSLEPRLHHPDRVVGRHRMQHIRIEESDHLAHATSIMCEMPSRDSDRLLFFQAGILSDSSSYTQGF